MTATEPKTERAPRTEAELGIEEIEFLPAKPGRTSKLQELLDQVKVNHPGKWLVVAKYEKSGAASAAASTLRAKHGPFEAGGWEFATRSIEGGAKTALFVRFQDDKIDPNATAAYAKVRAEREEKRLAKQAENAKDAEKKETKADRKAGR
jgi:hypothetical protein